jgi:hypothetical protein
MPKQRPTRVRPRKLKPKPKLLQVQRRSLSRRLKHRLQHRPRHRRKRTLKLTWQ